jgi:hypothetical protein
MKVMIFVAVYVTRRNVLEICEIGEQGVLAAPPSLLVYLLCK